MVQRSVILKKISQVRHNLLRLKEKRDTSLKIFKEDIDRQER